MKHDCTYKQTQRNMYMYMYTCTYVHGIVLELHSWYQSNRLNFSFRKKRYFFRINVDTFTDPLITILIYIYIYIYIYINVLSYINYLSREGGVREVFLFLLKVQVKTGETIKEKKMTFILSLLWQWSLAERERVLKDLQLSDTTSNNSTYKQFHNR